MFCRSVMVCSVKTCGALMPSTSGRRASAPWARTSLSYGSEDSTPEQQSRKTTRYATRSTAFNSVLTRTCTLYQLLILSAGLTLCCDSLAITPPNAYGIPHEAGLTSDPFSMTVILAVSSKRRSRVAQDMPPATPPMMSMFLPGDIAEQRVFFSSWVLFCLVSCCCCWVVVVVFWG